MAICISEFAQAVGAWGARAPLEAARALVEWGTLPFLEKDRRGDTRQLEGCGFVATAGAAAGGGGGAGGEDPPPRLARLFFGVL